ncbi:ABC transporter ATP-binding protein [Microlunatus soli]|uniref:ABC-2 type transport system ATP-binding protein n=1 Tax=Microlunatus soli TaxID=630515 RepID=A0A1H1PVE8_9ACTN|nr:ATP-binding cassette domain-containing protein [Microlunatus soli]SDS15311.1 ABC-2 type transport system ATP-binding protein [Microlunatus soli]
MPTATSPSPNSARAPVIQLSGIGKTYRFHRTRPGLRGSIRDLFGRQQSERAAVADLDLTIRSGEFVGLLGRNGAGKTTTLKMLSGLLRPSTGELRVLGHEPYRRGFDYLRQIAIVLGNKSMLWWDVSTRSNLELYEALYDLDHRDFERSVAELAEMLGVADHLDIPVRKLSLGERMKCELMLALVHRPQVLFLDEPTIGLDVVSKAAIRQFLAATCAEQGTTIILTSHDMDDVEQLCQRVVLIDHGRLRFDGTPEDLVRSTRPRKTVRCTFADPPIESPAPDLLPTGVSLIDADPTSGQLIFETERDTVAELLARATQWGGLVDLEVRDAELDDVMQAVLSDMPTVAGESAAGDRR